MNIEVANNKLLRILRGLTDESDDTAKTLFDRIGDKWDKSVWKKEVHFNSWRDWTYGKKQLDTETVTKYDYPDFNEIGGGYGQACEWIPIALLVFEKITTLFHCDFVIPAKAGIQLKTPGFRLKAGMTERHPLSKCLN